MKTRSGFFDSMRPLDKVILIKGIEVIHRIELHEIVFVFAFKSGRKILKGLTVVAGGIVKVTHTVIFLY